MVDEAGKRFYLDGLDVMSPLVIRLFAEDGSRPVDVTLHRFFWNDSDLSARTNETGDWAFLGRIHDEVGIELRAPEPTRFYLLAWMGRPAEVSFGSSAFAGVGDEGAPIAGGRDPARGGGLRRIGWIFALVALSIGAWAALGRLRRYRSAGAAISLLAIGLAATPAAGQGIENRLEAVENGLARLQELTEGDAEHEDYVSPEELADYMTWDQFDEELGPVFATIDRVLGQARAAFQGLFDAMAEQALDSASEIASLRAAVEALQLLHEADREAVPDPTHGGVPPMASSCYANPECAVCFERAHAALNEQLGYYSQLGVIYRTADAYLVAMTGYGDARSGWNQLEQAAWYSEKQKIVASHERLKTAYRNKLEEYNRRLKAILDDYGDCEDEYGLDDWYSRYGWPFYQSLTASYRLP
ncbi:MAG: hypothetical protein OES32_14060 [Acidobacteriota bacterium]|nr:hypothetical protein [Acidobacteriota bacterium]